MSDNAPEKVTGRIYISGPMSGLPEFNVPAFVAAGERLTGLGYRRVINPASWQKVGAEVGWAYSDYMREAIDQLTNANVLVQLPGWEDSYGAKLEYEIAKALEMHILPLDDVGPA